MGTISNDDLNDFLGEVREKAKGEEKLLEQFERCFLNTLETTVKMKEDGTVYVITGDIPAMWLRDSTAQIRPFLFPAKAACKDKSRSFPADCSVQRERSKGSRGESGDVA